MNLVDLGAELLNIASRLGWVRVERDLSYGAHERNRLDIYHPHRRQPGSPTLVFLYGGAWVKGSRQAYEFVGRAFAGRGYKTAIPDYRLLSHAPSGTAVVDVAQALGSIAEIDDEVILVGHSAGAQLGAALAYERPKEARPIIRAFIGLAGPYRYVGEIVRGPLPPALLLSAGNDRLVRETEAGDFATRLRERGVTVETRTYQRASHATLIGAVSPVLRSAAPVLKDIEQFLSRLGQSVSQDSRASPVSAAP